MAGRADDKAGKLHALTDLCLLRCATATVNLMYFKALFHDRLLNGSQLQIMICEGDVWKGRVGCLVLPEASIEESERYACIPE